MAASPTAASPTVRRVVIVRNADYKRPASSRKRKEKKARRTRERARERARTSPTTARRAMASSIVSVRNTDYKRPSTHCARYNLGQRTVVVVVGFISKI